MTAGPLVRLVLLVRDLPASRAFYEGTLGLGVAGPPGPGWVVYRAGGVLLCLRAPWEGMPFDAGDFGRSPDEVLFLVDDLDRSLAELRARDVVVSEPHCPGPGLRVAELRDPDGRRIALEERR